MTSSHIWREGSPGLVSHTTMVHSTSWQEQASYTALSKHTLLLYF